MSTFDGNSRYVKYSTVFTTTDRRGRTVEAVTPAKIPKQRPLGLHLRKQGQRLDHLSAHYLDDPFGFWRLAHHNDTLSPDVLADAVQVKIPAKG